MAHKVHFCIPKRELGRSDVEFEVDKEGELLGTLKISKGSIVWFPPNTRKGHKMSWAKFSQLMIENSENKEKR